MVVFGDGGNDIEMLRQAGFSFAMENAGNAVVAAAKYRAGSNNREGVLDVIDKVLNTKRHLTNKNGSTPGNTIPE